jgi:hypothetical protein
VRAALSFPGGPGRPGVAAPTANTGPDREEPPGGAR